MKTDRQTDRHTADSHSHGVKATLCTTENGNQNTTRASDGVRVILTEHAHPIYETDFDKIGKL